MNCREFARAWDDRLDLEPGVGAGRDAPIPGAGAFEAHASACPACRALDERYRALRRALRAWGAPPSPSAEFADRLLASPEIASASRGAPALRGRAWPRAFALAASLLLVLGLAARIERGSPRRLLPAGPSTVAEPGGSPALGDALAEATSATWDLARHASAPAARIGLRVFRATTARVPSAGLPDPARVVPTAGVFRGFEGRVQAGVRPLSGTARHAFGFLIDDASGEAEGDPPVPPRGA